MSDYRRKTAYQTRVDAAQRAYDRPHPRHRNNGEEFKYRASNRPSHIANFTKGLPHNEITGLLLSPADYRQFVLGIQSGRFEDFEKTPLGPGKSADYPGLLSTQEINPGVLRNTIWKSQIAQNATGKDGDPGADVRAWESSAGGLVEDLEGPDALAVTMPPAPTLDSPELAAEMGEVYLMALMRDIHFSQLRDPCLGPQCETPSDKHCGCDCKPREISPEKAADMLCDIRVKLPGQYDCKSDVAYENRCDGGVNWFKQACCELTDEERARHRSQVDRQHLFRGVTAGVDVGPYLSQFLLVGNGARGGAYGPEAGYINYGAIRADQRVQIATPCKDYMTTFEAWLDVQNGADLRELESYCPSRKDKCGHYAGGFRFMTTPRDLATYVHHDALYEAYLNACLILLGLKAPKDPGLPFGAPDIGDHQQGFAHFGDPHILTLVTEVATRALKAVRYQKFNNHRRLRPEALAGMVDRLKSTINPDGIMDPAKPLADALECSGILEEIAKHNKCQNKTFDDRKSDSSGKKARYLLPMAFPEGSPMHPAYGAGHATVAGACVTVLKAFFDHGWELPYAFEPNADGSELVPLTVCKPLTVEGELNKLAANIAIGRNWAGVHYYTDYIESLRMGEQIALGILEEQRLTYGENFTMTVPLFDGGVVRI
ncbi:MAG: vanadium-dependent haloperoxidase [Chromatiales bacterium]|nr:vanadium-dependent haloperoxidase [Chromatiales bacterium]